MNETTLARNDLAGANWQFFGEFESPVERNIGQVIYTWLVETLRPLNLKADFLEKVIASAQMTVEDSSTELRGPGQLYIRVYGTRTNQPPGQTWGFFRTEKKEVPPAEDSYRLFVTLYLYLEGK